MTIGFAFFFPVPSAFISFTLSLSLLCTSLSWEQELSSLWVLYRLSQSEFQKKSYSLGLCVGEEEEEEEMIPGAVA